MEKLHYFNNNFTKIDINKFEVDTNRIKVLFKNEQESPTGDNIVYFTGILSQNYPKWQKSRNGYKYKQDGWIFDNYKDLPIILWQHSDNYGWIWFMSKIWANDNKDICGLFWVDLDTLDPRNAKQVQKGMVRWISTGAISLESWFEVAEDWSILTKEEVVETYGYDELWKAYMGESDKLTYIVTKQEMVENSLVSIGSNAKALATQVNSLRDEMKIEADKIKDLYTNNKNMSEEKTTTEVEETTTELDTEETTADIPQSDEVTEDNKEVETDTNSLQDNVKTLTDQLAEAQTQIAELTKTRDELSTKVNELESKLRSELKKDAPAVVKWDSMKSMSMDEFKSKYWK